MPCHHNNPDPTAEEIEKVKRLRDAETRLACDRCRAFEDAGFPVPEWAQEWWLLHRREDRKRLVTDLQFLADEQKRLAVLEKLTPAEAELLGLL